MPIIAPIIMFAASLVAAVFVLFEVANSILYPIGVMVVGSIAAWLSSPPHHSEKSERKRH